MRKIIQNPKYLLLLIAALEGSAVMTCELIGARLIGPYFGSSLLVWTSVLGITMISLACGYYLGGVFSKRLPGLDLLFYVLLAAGALMFFMPSISKMVLAAMIDSGIVFGAIVSLMVYMFPVLLLFGMTPPIIINFLTHVGKNSGDTVGAVYAVSTVGGIVSTLVLGFYVLSEYGISKPAIVLGSVLFLMSSAFLIYRKQIIVPVVLFVFSGLVFKTTKPELTSNEHYNVLDQSEGIFGQIKVLDLDYLTPSRGYKDGRVLLVNNTGQTIMDLENPAYSLWDWAYYFPNAASIYPPGSNVLLLGLGGGTLVKQCERLKFDLEVVELDERVKSAAIDYFFVDPSTSIHIDDARHYIKTVQKKYDVIIFDMFLSETPPAHLLTVECFEEAQGILKTGGLLMINFYGYTSGNIGRASRCIYKTLIAAGFHTEMLVTPGDVEVSRNLIFLASVKELDFTKTNYVEPGLPVINNLEDHFLKIEEMNFEDALVLKDDLPQLELIYTEAALEWKRLSNDFYTKNLIKSNIAITK